MSLYSAPKHSSISQELPDMLQLFQSIFGSKGEAAPYPDELIKRGIERAVDGTDARLRVLPGYQKKLRAAVIHAIDHVVAMVDSLPAPLDLGRANYGANPELIAYFASAEHANEVLALDTALIQWLRSNESLEATQIVMLLLMEHHERQVFGIALDNDMLRRDVAQTTVSFAEHRLLDPTGSEEETRRLLKRRAFDHLLTLALNRIAAGHVERAELERERVLLRRKSAALAAGQWGFDDKSGAAPPDPQAVQQQLDDIESQLKALGAATGLLQTHLDIVVDVLSQAERNFWLEHVPLIVDRKGIKQTQPSELAPQLDLAMLRNAAGRRLVARVVRVARADLPAPRDLLR